jgi:hypothetical protein
MSIGECFRSFDGHTRKDGIQGQFALAMAPYLRIVFKSKSVLAEFPFFPGQQHHERIAWARSLRSSTSIVNRATVTPAGRPTWNSLLRASARLYELPFIFTFHQQHAPSRGSGGGALIASATPAPVFAETCAKSRLVRGDLAPRRRVDLAPDADDGGARVPEPALGVLERIAVRDVSGRKEGTAVSQSCSWIRRLCVRMIFDRNSIPSVAHEADQGHALSRR